MADHARNCGCAAQQTGEECGANKESGACRIHLEFDCLNDKYCECCEAKEEEQLVGGVDCEIVIHILAHYQKKNICGDTHREKDFQRDES